MIVLAATILFTAIILHACINYFTITEMQRRQEQAQQVIQHRQQEHETQFARQQAEMFRVETKKRALKGKPEIGAKVPCDLDVEPFIVHSQAPKL